MKNNEFTVLLVEDDLNDIFLVKRAFKIAKIENPLQVATDGLEAMQYLRGEGKYKDPAAHPLPKLIVMDIKMPRRSGFEVLEWLRQQPGLKPLIVVVLSSSSLISDINRAYDLGANSYLVKPGDFDTLIQLVKTLEAYWLMLNQNPDLLADPNPTGLASQVQCTAA